MCTDNLSYYLTCIDIMAIRFLDLNFYELVNNLKNTKYGLSRIVSIFSKAVVRTIASGI